MADRPTSARPRSNLNSLSQLTHCDPHYSILLLRCTLQGLPVTARTVDGVVYEGLLYGATGQPGFSVALKFAKQKVCTGCPQRADACPPSLPFARTHARGPHLLFAAAHHPSRARAHTHTGQPQECGSA